MIKHEVKFFFYLVVFFYLLVHLYGFAFISDYVRLGPPDWVANKNVFKNVSFCIFSLRVLA